MDQDTIDQAPEQSITDKIASKFGGLAEMSEAAAEETAATQAAEPDLFDLEYQGEHFQVPTKLKDAFMKNEDYTRKTQELAEQRRSLDQVNELAKGRAFEAAFNDSVANELREMSLIESYLAQASKQDWSSLTTDQILRQKLELDQIKERRETLKSAVAEKRTQFDNQVQTRLKEAKSKARELASKAIPNFTDETDKSVRSYAATRGLSEAEIDNVLLDPRSYQILWEAAQFRAVQANATQQNPTQKVLKPGASTNPMPQTVKDKLAFNRAMKSAKTSGEKANLIEDRLQGMFGRG